MNRALGKADKGVTCPSHFSVRPFGLELSLECLTWLLVPSAGSGSVVRPMIHVEYVSARAVAKSPGRNEAHQHVFSKHVHCFGRLGVATNECSSLSGLDLQHLLLDRPKGRVNP